MDFPAYHPEEEERFSPPARKRPSAPSSRRKSISDDSENKVVLFMKGTKSAPRCGRSNTCVQILESMDVPFTDVDILASEQLRPGMKLVGRGRRFHSSIFRGNF